MCLDDGSFLHWEFERLNIVYFRPFVMLFPKETKRRNDDPNELCFGLFFLPKVRRYFVEIELNEFVSRRTTFRSTHRENFHWDSNHFVRDNLDRNFVLKSTDFVRNKSVEDAEHHQHKLLGQRRHVFGEAPKEEEILVLRHSTIEFDREYR